MIRPSYFPMFPCAAPCKLTGGGREFESGERTPICRTELVPLRIPMNGLKSDLRVHRERGTPFISIHIAAQRPESLITTQ